MSGTNVCRKGTEQATNHVSYTNRDLPAEISDSGEGSGILEAQQGAHRRVPAELTVLPDPCTVSLTSSSP